MSGNIAITGIPTTPGPGGAVPLRRELRDLQKNFPDQFNLYILGLQNLQSVTEQDLKSYYQIAGIHGMPFKPWDGVGSNTDWATSGGFGGYCTHSSILFAPWHRPYLALYEQSLYASVQAVAQKFPANLKDKYVAAAKDFRMPYFDWATVPPTGSSAFPPTLASPNITIVDVDGKTKPVANPLNRFTFHPVNPSQGDFSASWSRYPSTVRYPDRITGQSRDSRVAPILQNELASLRSNVALLLNSYTEFDAFSFNQWDPNTNPGTYGSLEDVHNEIHDRTGGGGHMSALEVSAFDPFFWLHHTNVDRLWAIWQALNPSSFITPQSAPYSTFSVEGGDLQTQDSPLTPFWDKSGKTFWTSAQVKDSATFGYAYPETQKWKFGTTDAYQTAIRQSVATLYGKNVFSNFARTIASQPKPPSVAGATAGVAMMSLAAHPAKKDDGKQPIVHVTPVAPDSESKPPTVHEIHREEQKPLAAAAPGAKHDDHGHDESAEGPIPANLAHLAPDNKYTEWIFNVRAQKHGLGQSFRVLVFLGDINPDPDSWDLEYNCVGRVSVLGRSPDTQCGKCQTDMESQLMISGTVPLTSALLQDIQEGQLQSLKPEDVVPHLRDNLKWRVTLFTGEERNVAEVPGLKVSVCSTEVAIGPDGMPVYSGQYTVHPEITHGKPAGLELNTGEA
ncbi:hypothetical protein QBC46DRAFT_389579 [Diplogelasinospora grovesii]|uniref:tyrosinase n=1 Tax=Diplogelasinospora grovesii TaxID=303347 RepID=A0AAN6N4Q5_9PEZI|nr:hypothetical protein QBC46DRAFT_389579 [Diplogelasinospora grovesii]